MRDKLIEVMAKALCRHEGHNPYGASSWFNDAKLWEEWTDPATAALAALEAEGCRVVPVEPSEAMLDAGDYVWDGGSYLVWQTMLAAAQGKTDE